MLKPMDSAPDFTLSDQEEKQHTLSSYRGNWVILYFYPKDNTPGCTIEACSYRDNWNDIKDEAVLFGISTDSVESHQKFASKHTLPFPILSDQLKEVVKKYEVWLPKKFMGREFMGTQRSTFIINPQGNIAKIYHKVNPSSHTAEVINDLMELKKV